MAGMEALDALHACVRPLLGRRPVVFGIAGAQGSGKSTLATQLAARLTADGVAARAISLDDVYLTRARRRTLAAAIHPLMGTRGPPGSHDLPLLHHVLDRIRRRQPLALPRFDKLADDRLPPQHWEAAPALDCLIIEGWCLGAPAQPGAFLANPINMLEAQEDEDARWRTGINRALAGPYAQLWNRLDSLAFLAAPGWDIVPQWRQQQEASLAARQRRRGMDSAAIARFCAHYERLTRWMLATLPARAALTIQLDDQRRASRIHWR